MDPAEVMDSGSADEGDSMDPVEVMNSGSDKGDQYLDHEDEVDEELDMHG